MKGMRAKQDDLTKSMSDLEVNLTQKVDNILKTFQEGMKADMATMTKQIDEVDKSMRDFSKQLDELMMRTSKL